MTIRAVSLALIATELLIVLVNRLLRFRRQTVLATSSRTTLISSQGLISPPLPCNGWPCVGGVITRNAFDPRDPVVLGHSLSDQEQVSGIDRPVSVPHSREELAMRHTWLDRRLLGVIQRVADPVPVRMGLEPSSDEPLPSSSTFPVVRLKDRQTLIALLRSPEISFGDLYSQGDIEVDGDLVRLLETLHKLPQRMTSRTASRWLSWMQSNTVRAARGNIGHHYDIPTDFYRLWLDPQLVYTCAYFAHENASLEEAQRAKLDLVCRKLWLRPGETVVEAGCGWGALAIHMAKHYGVRVRAFNVSHEQIEFARQRAEQERLASAVDFYEDDYRNIGGKFDWHAGTRRARIPCGIRPRDSPGHRRQRSRTSAFYRPNPSSGFQRLDAQTHLSGRVPAEPSRSHQRHGAARLQRARYREPSRPLREDSGMLAEQV